MVVTEGGQKGSRVRLDLQNIHQALTTYQQRNGAWPAEEVWVETLVAAQVLERQPFDPWGTPYRYMLEANAAHPAVSSLGPDRTPDTADDVQASWP